jgi:hypothetical protein
MAERPDIFPVLERELIAASASDRLQLIIESRRRGACGNGDGPWRTATPANDNHDSFEQMVFERAVARELSGELDF